MLIFRLDFMIEFISDRQVAGEFSPVPRRESGPEEEFMKVRTPSLLLSLSVKKILQRFAFLREGMSPVKRRICLKNFFVTSD